MEQNDYQYSLCLLDDAILFNEDGWAELAIEISSLTTDDIELYSGQEDQITLAARVLGADANRKLLEPKVQDGEFRTESDYRILKSGEKCVSLVKVFVDLTNHENFVLEFDLVKERNFWFGDAGMTAPLQVPLERRAYITSKKDVGINNYASLMEKLKENKNKEYEKREERSEMIIFSLLNSLKKIAEKEAV